MDFVGDDLVDYPGTGANFLRVMQLGASGGYQARISTQFFSGIGRSAQPLLMQDGGGDFYVRSLTGSPIRKIVQNASHFWFSEDNYERTPIFAMFRPATNVLFGIHHQGTNLVLSGTVEDTTAGIPVVYFAKSHGFTTDGANFPLVVSNNAVRASNLTVNGLTVAGGTTVSSTLGVVDTVTLSGPLAVSGRSTFSNNVVIGPTTPVSAFWALATNIFFSYDGRGTAYPFFTIRPYSDVALTIDHVGASARIAPLDDSGAPGPLILQPKSLAVTSDSGASYGLVFTNNLLTAKALSIPTTAAIGGDLTGSGNIYLGTYTNNASGARIQIQKSGANAVGMTVDGFGGSASAAFVRVADGTETLPLPATIRQVGYVGLMRAWDGSAWNTAGYASFAPTSTHVHDSNYGVSFKVNVTGDGTTSVVNPLNVTATGTVVGDSGVTTPDTSVAFQINSTTRGFRMPRMTDAQRDAISNPAAGSEVISSSSQHEDIYNGGRAAWLHHAQQHPSAILSNWVISSLSAGTAASTNVTVAGATVGDFVMVSPSFLPSGTATVVGKVTALNQVTLYVVPTTISASPQTNSFKVGVFVQ
jgi:hypothetical protein